MTNHDLNQSLLQEVDEKTTLDEKTWYKNNEIWVVKEVLNLVLKKIKKIDRIKGIRMFLIC